VDLDTVSRQDFYDKYINGELSTDKMVNLNEVIEVTVILEKEVAKISHQEPCDMNDHREDRYKKILEFPKTSQMRLEDWKDLTTRPVKEYCNFFKYLICGAGGCECPMGMDWDYSTTSMEDKQCKFKKNVRCRDVHSVNMDTIQFAKFDFVEKIFDTEIDQECGDNWDCDYKDNKCADPSRTQFYWKPEDIAKGLHDLLDSKGTARS